MALRSVKGLFPVVSMPLSSKTGITLVVKGRFIKEMRSKGITGSFRFATAGGLKELF
jgi:hypothetical protein